MEAVCPAGKMMHFQVQTSSKVDKVKFNHFCVIYPMDLFYMEIPEEYCWNFSWTSVKTLEMEQVGPAGKNGAFSSSNMSKKKQR